MIKSLIVGTHPLSQRIPGTPDPLVQSPKRNTFTIWEMPNFNTLWSEAIGGLSKAFLRQSGRTLRELCYSRILVSGAYQFWARRSLIAVCLCKGWTRKISLIICDRLARVSTGAKTRQETAQLPDAT